MRNRSTLCGSYLAGFLGVLFPLSLIAQPLPLFDSHLHYSQYDAESISPQAVVQKLDKNGVRYAAVTGTPATHVRALHQYAPDRIVPLLSVYRHHGDKESWTKDRSLPDYVEKELARGHWRGIGEIHIFAKERHSLVFQQVVEIASRQRLPLLIHGDPAVIDAVYEMRPDQRVVWAHAGTFPYPDLVADYLQRYPMLMIDLSKRDERVAPDGELDDAWYELFVSYPDRFMVGVDTYSLGRWNDFDGAVATTRHWLDQLPDDVARKLSYENAAVLFSIPD